MLLEFDLHDILAEYQPTPVVESLHEGQLGVQYERARFFSELCGRQSGKSWGGLSWLQGGRAGEVSLYCAQTAKSAKSILLPAVSEMNYKFDLGLKVNRADLTVTEPSGHVIQLAGIKDQSAADDLRGPHYRKIMIDECGTFPSELLKYAVENVVQPMLVTTGGSLMLAGTPGVVPEGYFYEITGDPATGKKGRWPNHHWTTRDNTAIERDPEEVIREILENNLWTEDNPTFRREYLAEWVEDVGARIFQGLTSETVEPPTEGLTVMALDFGVVDHFAVVILRQKERPRVNVCYAFSESDLNMGQIADIIRPLLQRWRPNYIVGDAGALGLGYVKTLKENFGIHQLEKADKRHKRAGIDMARGFVQADMLDFGPEATELRSEMSVLPWNVERTDFHPKYKHDCADGLLYGLRKILATEGYKPPEFEMTPEERHAEEIRRRVLARTRNRGSSI